MNTLASPSHIDRATLLCTLNPRAAHIRDGLLKIEQQAHHTGWNGANSQPAIFQVDAQIDGDDVEITLSDFLTDCLRMHSAKCDWELGPALHVMAEILGGVAAIGRTGKPPQSWKEAVDSMVESGELNAEQVEGLTNRYEWGMEVDLIPPLNRKDNWRFHGLALRYEAWGPNSASKGFGEAAVNRTKMRGVFFSSRDGYRWNIERLQKQKPTVAAFPPGDPTIHATIPNALAKLVNDVSGRTDPTAD